MLFTVRWLRPDGETIINVLAVVSEPEIHLHGTGARKILAETFFLKEHGNRFQQIKDLMESATVLLTKNTLNHRGYQEATPSFAITTLLPNSIKIK